MRMPCNNLFTHDMQLKVEIKTFMNNINSINLNTSFSRPLINSCKIIVKSENLEQF